MSGQPRICRRFRRVVRQKSVAHRSPSRHLAAQAQRCIRRFLVDTPYARTRSPPARESKKYPLLVEVHQFCSYEPPRDYGTYNKAGASQDEQNEWNMRIYHGRTATFLSSKKRTPGIFTVPRVERAIDANADIFGSIKSTLRCSMQ